MSHRICSECGAFLTFGTLHAPLCSQTNNSPSASKDATIARLEAEVAKWEASANATHKAASDNAARASKAEAEVARLTAIVKDVGAEALHLPSERQKEIARLRLALTAAADALAEAQEKDDGQ